VLIIGEIFRNKVAVTGDYDVFRKPDAPYVDLKYAGNTFAFAGNLLQSISPMTSDIISKGFLKSKPWQNKWQ